ncbi:MAG TPA: hypothetical protein VGM41_07410 [Chitinophagaceae bacterium]|jgi:hypothetical protein
MPEDDSKKQFNALGKLIDSIAKVTTPMKLFAFILAAICLVVAMTKSIPGLLLFFIVILFPLVIVFTVLNGRFLGKMKNSGFVAQFLVLLVMLLCFTFSGYFMYCLFNGTSISDNKGSLLSRLLNPGISEQVKDNTNALYASQRIYDNTIGEFDRTIDVNSQNPEQSFTQLSELKDSLEKISEYIIELKAKNIKLIYGDKNIEGLYLKLLRSQLSLYFSKYIMDFISTIIDPPQDKQLRVMLDNNHALDCSQLEADLLHALGNDFLNRRISDMTTDDIDHIKTALKQMGIARENIDGVSAAAILWTIKKMLPAGIANKNFIELADYREFQLEIYGFLEQMGYVDFKKTILNYATPASRKFLSVLLEEKIDLLTPDEALTLRSELYKKLSSSVQFEQLDEAIADFSRFVSSNGAESIITAPTVEDYIKQSVHWLSDDAHQDKINFFVNITPPGVQTITIQKVELVKKYEHIYAAINQIEGHFLSTELASN